MPYGTEDYQHLGHVFVSHARFFSAGITMGSAIIGADYWLTTKELSKLEKKVGELQLEVKDLKQEMKQDVAQLQKGINALLQKK